MKKVLFTLFCSFLFIANANAKGSPFYMAIKAGIVDAGNGMSDNAVNAGFDIGYRNNRYISTEVEYTTTFISGDTPSGNNWEMDAFSVFASFRSNTKVKLKAKVGLSSIDNNDSGLDLSMGIGVSYWAAGGLMDIEYTKLDDGLNFYSIGVNYFF